MELLGRLFGNAGPAPGSSRILEGSLHSGSYSVVIRLPYSLKLLQNQAVQTYVSQELSCSPEELNAAWGASKKAQSLRLSAPGKRAE